MNDEFFLQDGIYYHNAGTEKVATPLTNFEVKISKFSENYMEGTSFTTTSGTKKFKCSKSELLKKNGMLENFGYFLKGDAVAQRFLLWLEMENFEHFSRELEYFGITDGKYYDEESQAICGKKDLKIKNMSEIGSLTDEDIKILNNNLIKIRKDTNQSLMALCWAAGRFIQLETYPILEVCGTTSIGKSEFIENISKLLFGVEDNIKNFSTLTNHQIRSIASCSNITPFIIDEVKITSKNSVEKGNLIFGLIRSIYDNKTINKGNVGEQLDEYKLKTPLIISGESQFNDVSIKNRMVQIKLTQENKGEREVYSTFKNSDILYKLGKKILENQLEKKLEFKLYDFKKIKDDRQIYNASCLVCGLELIRTVLTIDNVVIDNFIKYLEDVYSEEYTPEINFFELLELTIESDNYNNEYYCRKGEFEVLRWEMFYKRLSEVHQKTGSTLELLDSKTLRKQLIEIGVIIKNSHAVQFNPGEVVKKAVLLKKR